MNNLKYNGDVLLKGNLDVLSNKPLDTRSVVLNKTDLYSMNPTYAYEGMPVVCLEDRTIYILVDKARILSSEGWTKLFSENNQRTDFSVLSESEYENLQHYDDILYFVYEQEEGWTFPITLT